MNKTDIDTNKTNRTIYGEFRRIKINYIFTKNLICKYLNPLRCPETNGFGAFFGELQIQT